MKEALSEKDKEDVNKDYIFKSIDQCICKLMNNIYEDIIPCKSKLQEMQLWSKKQVSDLELKMDSANASTKGQLSQQNEKIMELITQTRAPVATSWGLRAK